MRRRGRLRNKTQQVMLYTVFHHTLADPHSAPRQWLAPQGWLSPVYSLSRLLYGMEYSLGQFRSAVLTMLPPDFLCSCFLGEHKKFETPWFRVSATKTSAWCHHYSLTKFKIQHCITIKKKMNSMMSETRKKCTIFSHFYYFFYFFLLLRKFTFSLQQLFELICLKKKLYEVNRICVFVIHSVDLCH